MGTSHDEKEKRMLNKSIEESIDDIVESENYFCKSTKGSMLRSHLDMLISKELQRAEKLHPNYPKDIFRQLAIMQEEAGEVTKAVLDYKDGKGPLSDVYKELIQTTAMCHRMLRNLHLIEKEPLKLESKHIDFKKLLGEPQFTNDGGYSESQVFEAMEKLINVK